MWIAFKFVSLYRMTQPAACRSNFFACCELLSNLYLCIGWHSSRCRLSTPPSVVNCFQICIFVSDDTATDHIMIQVIALWIAFKFVSLYRMTQLCFPIIVEKLCCELLSNLYLCIGWHSIFTHRFGGLSVVNCFQICIFVSDDTARGRGGRGRAPLWIAFKFVSLYRMTQQ